MTIATRITRGTALAALAIFAAAFVTPQAEAAKAHRHSPSAAAPAVPSGPAVDVTRLRQIGLGQMADMLRDRLSADLRAQGVSGRIVVRLTGLSLAPFAGSEGGGGGSSSGGGAGGAGSNSDYLDGEILTLGSRGEILSSRPQLVSLSASSGGAYYLPDFEQRRIAALTQAYAAWVARSL